MSNRLVNVDLDRSRFTQLDIPAQIMRQSLGGRGLGAAILDESRIVPDPLDPAAIVCMLTGPLNGTAIPLANRLSFVFRSPLTGTIASAITGGYVAASLGAAGLAGVLLRGRAPAPVILELSREGARLHDASDLRGRGAMETTDRLTAAFPDARVVAIGPAGEALSPVATVINEKGRASGVRHGIGAVLGSKNVKAIILRGGKAGADAVDEARPLRPLIKRLHAKLRGSPILSSRSGALALHGTAIAMEALGEDDSLPGRNYRLTVVPRYRDLGGLRMSETILVGRETCTSCPVRCRREVRMEGRHAGHGEGPDFAQLTSLGTSCDLSDLAAVSYMNLLCFDLGLDPVEVGNTLAMLAEATERGLLTPAEGLRWGDADRMIAIIERAMTGEPPGDLVAMGAVAAAARLGDPTLAMASKGITIQNVDPRAEPAWGLLNATEASGASAHIWSFADLIEGLTPTGVKPLVGRDGTPEEIARAVRWRQDLNAVIDSLSMCTFSSYAYDLEDYAEAFSLVTGEPMGADELLATGASIVELERRYNQRLGVTAAADTLPPRFTADAVPTGRHRGRTLELPALLGAYYRQRGWPGGEPAAVARRHHGWLDG